MPRQSEREGERDREIESMESLQSVLLSDDDDDDVCV